MAEKNPDDIMAECLLKGGKMLSKACRACGSPLFEVKGETLCVVCREKGKETGPGHRLPGDRPLHRLPKRGPRLRQVRLRTWRGRSGQPSRCSASGHARKETPNGAWPSWRRRGRERKPSPFFSDKAASRLQVSGARSSPRYPSPP